MTLHNELHSPFFFALVLLSKRSLYCTGQSASPFYLQKKKTLVATVWSIKLLKERPPHTPPPFIRLPERNIKLSVFPSDRRMEISSLSIKMSRYFISVPVGLWAPTLFTVALLYSSLVRPPRLSLCPRPASRLVGVYAASPAPQRDWLGPGPQVRLLISISGLRDWGWMMLCRL